MGFQLAADSRSGPDFGPDVGRNVSSGLRTSESATPKSVPTPVRMPFPRRAPEPQPGAVEGGAEGELPRRPAKPHLVYLHGFNSSPKSVKARHLAEVMASRGEASQFACPALPDLPAPAIALARTEVERAQATDREVTLIGSSLGGFYATWLAEQCDCRAVLINPAVTPHVGLRRYLGPQKNLYTDEPYTLTEAHLEQWAGLAVAQPTAGRYLLLVETGDEVLDYRAAVSHYAGARQIVVHGGDHSFQSFEKLLPDILEFAGFGN